MGTLFHAQTQSGGWPHPYDRQKLLMLKPSVSLLGYECDVYSNTDVS